MGRVPKSRLVDHARHCEREQGAQSNPRHSQSHCSADDAELDTAGRFAESHPDADLPGLLRDGVGDYAIDAQGGQEQPQSGKDAYQQHKEAAWRGSVVDQALDGPELGHRLSGIERRVAMTVAASTSGGNVVRTTSSAPAGPAWVIGK